MSDNMEIRRLVGRCSNGCEADGGKRWHIVIGDKALCGAEPGRRSAGWSAVETEQATCPRCLKRAGITAARAAADVAKARGET